MKLEAKLLLCVSADQATVAAWRRRTLAECRRFDNDEQGWAAFSNYLRAARGLPVHVIVDTVDEDFRFETLPHARGGDRLQMVGRKLKQLYRGTPYYAWSLQERATGKRREDRYLFVALTNADVLAPWLRAMTEAPGNETSSTSRLADVLRNLPSGAGDLWVWQTVLENRGN